MVEFEKASIYIEKACTTKEKIAKVDQIISALLSAAIDGAANEGMTSYVLDDGQTKINCMYRSTDSVFQSIKSFEKLKTYYMNQLNGHTFRLVDSKNFNRNCNGNR